MRKSHTKIRTILPDPMYPHSLVTKLINRSMFDGKRSVAQKQVYNAFVKIQQDLEKDPLQVFLQAVETIKPSMEVRARRIGGASYQVPTPVRGIRKESLAIRWLIKAANTLPNSQYHTYGEKLAAEIMSAYKGEGGSVAKKQEMERVAEANKAFSHFKW